MAIPQYPSRNMDTTKKCSECGRDLPLSAFNRCAREIDGHQKRCRECFSTYNAERYRADPEHFKRQVAKYRGANPTQVFQTRLATWKKNPTRQNVYKLVEAALSAGVITRTETCSICGTSESNNGNRGFHAHHFDYANPLSVVWVCTACHHALHKVMRIRADGPRTVEEALVMLSSHELAEVLGMEWKATAHTRQSGKRGLRPVELSALQDYCRKRQEEAA